MQFVIHERNPHDLILGVLSYPKVIVSTIVILTADRPYEDPANILTMSCLPLSTRQSQVRELVSPYGQVASIQMVEEKSSRGFGKRSLSAIIVFERSNQAEKAQAAIDGKYMGEGWRIKASWGDMDQQKGTPSLSIINYRQRNTFCPIWCFDTEPGSLKAPTVKGTTP